MVKEVYVIKLGVPCMNKRLPLIGFLTFISLIMICLIVGIFPSQACGGGGDCNGGCGGNMNIASWGPSNYQERSIYPLRGCGPTGCIKGWRSAIISPPPNQPYGGQVLASPPIGCTPPINTCGGGCNGSFSAGYFGGR